MKIQESAENYLETILILSRKNPHVRSIDIANELAFSRPSASVVTKNLRENGYVLMDDQGHITFSSMGKEVVETMYERHTILSQWLMYFGVDEQIAAKDVYRTEHVVSAGSSWVIKDHIIRGYKFPEDSL